MTYVGKVERAECVVSVAYLLCIAKALRVPAGDLLAGLELHVEIPPEDDNQL